MSELSPLWIATLLAVPVLAVLVAAVWLGARMRRVERGLTGQSALIVPLLEEKHRAMLGDLHGGLADHADRMHGAISQSAETLRGSVGQELKQTREALQILQLAQARDLGLNRETTAEKLTELARALGERQEQLRAELTRMLHETLAEQGRAQAEQSQGAIRLVTDQGRLQSEVSQATMRAVTEQLAARVDALTQSVEARLGEIGGRVDQRLADGFRQTNDTFASVMARLATIDEAQKKIDALAGNVVSLQDLLGDKRARGALGEVQLEALVRNALPPNAYEFQAQLPGGLRADCLLLLPEPTGRVAIDAKFPLENYRRMFDGELPEAERALARRQFKADVRRHVEDIAAKYIVAGETSDAAVMFLPAESLFAEIHAYHPDLIELAIARRVWIVSPTTMMAILNTARAVIKDVETRRQVHVIRDALSKLGKEFERFDHRMQQLANHIRQAHDDVQDVHITSRKISERFRRIEQVELDHPAAGTGPPPVPELPLEGGRDGPG